MIGRTLEHYKVVAKIGEGGMGSVYRAVDLRLDRPVALKILPEDLARDGERLARFRQEARSLAMLNHPNIVSIYEFGAAGGVEYAVVELLEGETLRQVLRRGPLPRPTILDYAIQLARGLAAAHQRGIIHRDLKPENMFVNSDGIVKILDFGLARQLEPAPEHAADQNLTEPGFVVGSASYMSPEQVRARKTDERTDVFSFGSVLYEMLTGKSAFGRDSAVESMHAVIDHNPIELVSEARRDRLFAVAARCLEKAADRRYSNGGEILRALEEARDASAARIAAASPEPQTPAIRSLAVLAFDDMSPARDHAYFCEGIAEELINSLATVEGLRVAARTSAFQFRGSATDIRKIGAELGVDGVVEGSVRVAGDRIRVTAQLIDARNGYHVWSQRFDRSSGDIFEVQDELAATMLEALRMRVGEAEAHDTNRPPGGSLEAYDLYLRGRHELRHRQENRMVEAVRLFEQAVEIDPSYAAALAGIAFAESMLGYYMYLSPSVAAARAREAAERALALAPESAEAHTMMGLVRMLYDWKWDHAAHHFQRAVAISPKNTDATGWYSFLLSAMGHPVEAVAMVARCRASDPLSPWANAMEGVIRRHARDFAASNEALHRALELQPDSILAWYHIVLNESDLGNHDRAVEHATRLVDVSGGALPFLIYLAGALQRAGRHAECDEVERSMLARSPGAYFSDGVEFWLATARKSEDVYERMEKALAHRLPWLVSVSAEPWFDPIRGDARFDSVLRELGLQA